MQAAPAFVFALLTFCGSPAFADDLLLACSGSGDRTTTSSSFGTVTSPYGDTYTGQGTQLRRETISERVMVEITGDTARIFVPASLLPPIRGGSDAGWRALDRLSITDRSITGRFDLNIFNKPTVEIDRTTGTIEIDGFGNTSYSGICERVEAQERRF
ncbi:MAG: hypothetical protein AB7G40_14795 [Hyphomonadaceae bacterium]